LHIVVLVHGTWAMNAKWTRNGAALINEVLSALGPQNVAIYARDWSGRNSVRQRYLAAAVLKNDLNDLGARFPRATLNVVGHSHGGNVAAKAIGDIGSQRIGLACLSTPFLRARHRRAGAWSAKIIVSNISFLLFSECDDLACLFHWIASL
jgi:alpha-beta hydrolase superfamily lysophospholipase